MGHCGHCDPNSRSVIGPQSDCRQVDAAGGHRVSSSGGSRAVDGLEQTWNVEANFYAHFIVYSDIWDTQLGKQHILRQSIQRSVQSVFSLVYSVWQWNDMGQFTEFRQRLPIIVANTFIRRELARKACMLATAIRRQPSRRTCLFGMSKSKMTYCWNRLINLSQDTLVT